ncbi:Hypothetical predicted protein [Olea europaea subsp. europaea]|uniref:Uncharacterized protein n=1 Tax=Olea europaea subsp. europaea TaxID=158383 RepID=A0A8S0QJW3_OLEEU|nr:Hypothetical predicted protein [Olea europaea subsp. europaea]
METKVMVIMIVGEGSGDDDFAGAKRMSDDDGDCCIGVDSCSVVEVKEMAAGVALVLDLVVVAATML